MKLKPNDLVLMNKHGLRYHLNVDELYSNYKVGDTVNKKNFQWAVCELLAIQGVGEVISVTEDAVEVKFRHWIAGMFFYNTIFYDSSKVTKLGFFQKLKYKLLGRV